MTETEQRNIYCLEGNWNKHPKSKQSIKPILDLLQTSCNVKYIYKRCLTKEEFISYLEKFTQKRYKNYPILYIAFHGRKNKILIGNEYVTLKEISNLLEGKLEGKMVHFGSCSTLGTTERNISEFISTTKCKFISGYKRDVNYILSTAFELLYLEILLNRYSDTNIFKLVSSKYFSIIKEILFTIATI